MTNVHWLSRVLRMDVFRGTSLPIWVGVAVLLGGVAAAKIFLGIPFRYTMGDPATVTGERFYLGLASNVGALLWAANASILFFSSGLHRRRGGDPEVGRFLLCSGLFVALLGIDDMFMLHEQVFPDHLGVRQTFVVAGYGAFALLYAARFASVLAQTAYPVFVAALGMLGVSAGLDQLRDLVSIDIPGALFWEDAAKLIGIATWLSYSIHTGAALLSGDPTPRRETGAAPGAVATPALATLRLSDPQQRARLE